MRRNCLDKLLIDGKVDGRRGRGRSRYDVLADLVMGRNYEFCLVVLQVIFCEIKKLF